MKFLLLTNDFYPNNKGGMSNYYTELCHAGGMDSFYVLTPDPESEVKRNFNCNVIRLKMSNDEVDSVFSRNKILKKTIHVVDKYDIDIVLCGNFRPYGDIAYKIFLKRKIPYYIFFHGNDLLRLLARMKKYFFKNFQYKKILLASNGYIANSNYVMNYIPKEFKTLKSCLVLNPGVGEEFENLRFCEPFLNNKTVTLLTVGRLDRRKGVETVIKAVGLLKKRGYQLEYNVVGKGDLNFYSEIACKSNVTEMVNFHGFLSDEKLKKIYQKSDIFLMVSNFSKKNKNVEGFGIVYLEANAFGKPVIASNCGGIPDAVVNNKSGFLVSDPYSFEEVADNIEYLCTHPDVAKKMGEYGYKRVNEKFTYSKIVKKLKGSISKDMVSV